MSIYEELLAAQTELAHFNPNHDKLGRFSKKQDAATGDIVTPKGHVFKRVYTEYNTSNSPSFKDERLYISDNEYDYLNDHFISDVSRTKVQTFKSDKRLLFAGEDSINKILKEIGNKPLNKVFDEHGNYNKEKSGTDRDFLMNDIEIGKKFIKKALSTGFDGIRDPVDDLGLGFSPTAKILFNKGAISLIKDEPIDKYL